MYTSYRPAEVHRLLFEAIPLYPYEENIRRAVLPADPGLKFTPTFASSYGDVKGKVECGEISTINSERSGA